MRLLNRNTFLICTLVLFDIILVFDISSHSKKEATVLAASTPTNRAEVVSMSPTLTPTPTQTISPVLTATPTPIYTPSPSFAQQSPKDFIMQEINNYRASHGLYEVKTNEETCSFARTRAAEIVSAFNHDGFNNRISAHSLPYQSYSSITENIAKDSDYKKVVEMWINSPGHAKNMQADTPFVCVEQSGNYFAYEGLKP